MSAAYNSALSAWKQNGGPRPYSRPDGIPTRMDRQWHTPAETAIREAMLAVEAAGASPALTDAITLLGKARDRVADHVEERPAPVGQRAMPHAERRLLLLIAAWVSAQMAHAGDHHHEDEIDRAAHEILDANPGCMAEPS